MPDRGLLELEQYVPTDCEVSRRVKNILVFFIKSGGHLVRTIQAAHHKRELLGRAACRVNQYK